MNLPSRAAVIYIILIFLTSSISITLGCFNSIISFGNSYADTGNLIHLTANTDTPNPASLPPYGETFFHHPTGRFSDGRLIIDFIAEHFGLPFVPPYFGVNNTTQQHISEGVNFAVAGATALDYTYLGERGIYNPITNVSLGTELVWFKQMLINACPTSLTYHQFLERALVIIGEIGGNDINFAFFQRNSKEEAQSLVVPIISTISMAVIELIELGALTIMVPGNIPFGCLPAILTYYRSSDKKDYDPSTGCITWINDFAEHYNELLQLELNNIRALHPHATIIYADYYNALMQIYRSPTQYGFTKTLTACCGAGDQYNNNVSVPCGFPPSTTCDDPSLNVNWDGLHGTEATYKLIANGLLDGPYTIPPIYETCSYINLNYGLSKS